MKPNPICFTKKNLFEEGWEGDFGSANMREFLFGNVQIGFTSEGLVSKASCMELETPHETRSYLHYQAKIQIWEWGRERFREEKDW